MKNNFVFNPVQIIFTLVGAGMLLAGYFSSPGALTDDGYPLNNFFFMMGTFFIVWPIILFGTIKYFINRSVKKTELLIATGIKGNASVRGITRTHVAINRIPKVIPDLDIRTDLGESFTATYKKCIDPIYYSLITPEAKLPVYIDPANKKHIYVDFKEAWSKAASARSRGV